MAKSEVQLKTQSDQIKWVGNMMRESSLDWVKESGQLIVELQELIDDPNSTEASIAEAETRLKDSLDRGG